MALRSYLRERPLLRRVYRQTRDLAGQMSRRLPRRRGALATREDIIRLHELQMLSVAGRFDLWKEDGRQASADAVSALFFQLTKILQPKLFIEAGAKAATTSIRARSICPKARIVAFEANPYNVEMYNDKFDYASHRVEYLSLALSNRSEQVSFFVRTSVGGEAMPRESGRSSLLRRNDPSTTYEEVTVQAVALDDHLPERVPNCMWIDVEGATRQVLEGASALLDHTMLALVEAGDRPIWENQWLSKDIIAFMFEKGLMR